MDAVGVIAVVGACVPERTAYAKDLAMATNRTLFPATRLHGSRHPAEEAAVLASLADPAVGALVEFPEEVSVTEIIAVFAESSARAQLRGVVCVVDAAHVLDDLARDDYISMRDADSGVPSPFVARAQLAVTQIELASTILLVNWSPLTPDDLAVIVALLNHLSPRARLRLARGEVEIPETDVVYGHEQDRAGWVCLLNRVFEPHVTDVRVNAVHYEQLRPLHPGRLMGVLDRIAADEFGSVIRSAGFCRFVTRASVIGQWEHVGRVISLNPLAIDGRLGGREELLALGQELAIIGIDLKIDALVEALDSASLTDEELLAGPMVWETFEDPFPVWRTVSDRSD